MLDHVGIRCGDFAASLAFYRAALAPLGVSVVMEVTAEQTGADAHVGLGRDRPFFWLSSAPGAGAPVHVAFQADRRDQVDAFHQAALAAGGRDNGAPGPRPHYHPHYYGGFVLDPDGNNVEAVCHHP